MLNTVTRKPKMKRRISRTGKLLGGYVPASVVQGIQVWVEKAPERDVSTFLREASREKLRRENIPFSEKNSKMEGEL
jgi:hypothetical protein